MRRVPHARAWNVGLRTLHLMAFGVLLGGHFWGVQADLLYPSLAITVASGAALMGLELYQSAHWLFLVVAVASVGAHMPARYRHYSVLHRRVLLPEPVPLPEPVEQIS